MTTSRPPFIPTAGQEHRASSPFLESTVRGTPGGPVENAEPFRVREAAELVDGPVVAPPPDEPRRKRKPVRKADMPAVDRDAVSLARFARKLKGQE
jgi:hypothetical protein